MSVRHPPFALALTTMLVVGASARGQLPNQPRSSGTPPAPPANSTPPAAIVRPPLAPPPSPYPTDSAAPTFPWRGPSSATPRIETPAPPTEPSDYNLLQLEELAQSISPNLREAAAKVESNRGTALQVGLYPNPTVNWGSPQWTGSQSQYYQFLTQEIVVAGKLRLNRSAAVRAVEQAELAFVRARFDLLTAVRTEFYNALASQRKVEILKSLVEITTKSRDSSVKLREGGEGTQADVLLLEIELERAEVALQNAEALLAAAKRRLAAALGEPTLPIRTVVGDLATALPDYEFEFLREGILAENALVSIAQIEVIRNQTLLRRARREPIPNPIFLGGYQYQVEAPGQHQGLFQITLPVPVWNRNQGNIRAARANIANSAEALLRLQNDLSNQAADALGRFIAFSQLTEKYEDDILPRADQTQSLAQQGYQQGQFDFLRLLASQRTLIDANLGYIAAQEGRWTAAAEIGGLLQQEEFPPPVAGDQRPPKLPPLPTGELPAAPPGPKPKAKAPAKPSAKAPEISGATAAVKNEATASRPPVSSTDRSSTTASKAVPRTQDAGATPAVSDVKSASPPAVPAQNVANAAIAVKTDASNNAVTSPGAPTPSDAAAKGASSPVAVPAITEPVSRPLFRKMSARLTQVGPSLRK